PDVALLDARLPDGSGIDVCRDIRSALPSTYCLILTSYDDHDALLAAVLAGASGYVLKEVRVGAGRRHSAGRARALAARPGPDRAGDGPSTAGAVSARSAAGTADRTGA
ncbi:MAG TPA: response regulator, partial [Solirubrobacteraceae bacterium]|nr:response regulator [Solirubrobacteraceae bacterium]